MRILLPLICLIFWTNASSQSNFPKAKKKSSPISVLHHKFDSASSAHKGLVNMTVPEHRTCLTTEVNAALQEKFHLPSIENFEKEFDKQKIDYLERRSSQRTTSTLITIPVIVHVIHNGESIGSGSNITAAQVRSQIVVLNEDFRKKTGTSGFNTHPSGSDVEIEFAIALRDEFGNELEEPGIHRVDGNKQYWESNDIEGRLKPQTIWNPTKYLNMWTVNFGGENSDLLGYAQFPSLSGLDGAPTNGGLAATDGVVMGYKVFGREGNIDSPYDGGRTATHEVGHWLGLRHIWGDGDCSVDDYCDDTPMAGHPNYECKSVNSCSLYPEQDMIENYMDYTPDACMNVFTKDQKDRMQTVMNVSPRRKELLNSTVHLALESPIAYFNSNRTNICAGETIDFTDESINTPTSWQWIFLNSDSEVVGTFSDENPSITFNGSGIYSLILIVENSHGADTLYNPNYIAVLSSQELSLPFDETFEFVNALDNWIYYNPDNDRKWQETSAVSSQGGSWSVYFDNYSNIDGDPTGNVDALISPSIDLSANQNAYLEFDVAYAKYGGAYSDTLAVFISTDCGNNFTPIWVKGGDDLATAPDNQETFIPNSDSEWITEKIPLKDFNGYSNVHIALVNISGWGNNLYLDNISILQPSYSEPSYTLFWTPKDTVTVGSTVNFWDYSEEYPTSWFWEFEGATPTTSNGQNPSVTYNTAGTFDVKLTTSNSSGGDDWLQSDYLTVVNNPNVVVNSSSVSGNICEGDSIVLMASGANFYEWYDDRGYLISESHSLIAYPQLNTTYEVIGYDIYGGADTIAFPVTLNPNFNETASVTICEGVSYSFGTQALTTTGSYTEVFQSRTGCDSTVLLTLTVNPISNETASATICEGESYSFGTQTLTTAGNFTEVFQSQANCDSTVLLSLTVNNVFNETASATICEGESYSFGTQNLTTVGNFTEVFQSQSNCDSTVLLSLIVNNVFNETATATICEGDNYSFGTQILTTAGNFTEVFQSQSSCDSTIVLTLTVNPVFNETASTTICEGESFSFGTQTLTTAGDFTEVLQSHTGCDSIVVLTLGIKDQSECIIPLGVNKSLSDEIKIYPNPFEKEILFEFTEPINGEIQIHDVSGLLVYKSVLINTKNERVNSIKATGTYIVTIQDESGKTTNFKVIKQ
jgi:PKD repeat protein